MEDCFNEIKKYIEPLDICKVCELVESIPSFTVQQILDELLVGMLNGSLSVIIHPTKDQSVMDLHVCRSSEIANSIISHNFKYKEHIICVPDDFRNGIDMYHNSNGNAIQTPPSWSEQFEQDILNNGVTRLSKYNVPLVVKLQYILDNIDKWCYSCPWGLYDMVVAIDESYLDSVISRRVLIQSINAMINAAAKPEEPIEDIIEHDDCKPEQMVTREKSPIMNEVDELNTGLMELTVAMMELVKQLKPVLKTSIVPMELCEATTGSELLRKLQDSNQLIHGMRHLVSEVSRNSEV